MTLARIGLPGGLTAQTWQLEELRESGRVAFYETGEREVVLYWRDMEPDEVQTVDLDLVAGRPGDVHGARVERVPVLHERGQGVDGWAEGDGDAVAVTEGHDRDIRLHSFARYCCADHTDEPHREPRSERVWGRSPHSTARSHSMRTLIITVIALATASPALACGFYGMNEAEIAAMTARWELEAKLADPVMAAEQPEEFAVLQAELDAIAAETAVADADEPAGVSHTERAARRGSASHAPPAHSPRRSATRSPSFSYQAMRNRDPAPSSSSSAGTSSPTRSPRRDT